MFNDEVIIRSQQRFKSDHHRVYTEEVNKIALSSNDDKRIQTFDKVTTYPYGTNTFMVCENEMLPKINLVIETKIKIRLVLKIKIMLQLRLKIKIRLHLKLYTEDKDLPDKIK